MGLATSCEMAKILTVDHKSRHPGETFNFMVQNLCS